MNDPEKLIHHALETGANYRPASQTDLARFEIRLHQTRQRQVTASRRRWLLTAVAAAAVAGVVVLGVAVGPRAGAPHSATSPASQLTEQGGVLSELVGWTYQSTSVSGFTLQSGTAVQITFDTDGRIWATAGCNSLATEASVQSGRLSAGPMSVSMLGCGTGLEAQDRWLSNLLTSRPTFVVAGTELTVATGATSISLVRKEFKPPAATLKTSSIPEPIPSTPLGDFVSSKTTGLGLPTGVAVQMTFTADTVIVRGGCNTFSFPLVIKGDLITAADSASTMKACADGRSAWDKSSTKGS